MAPNLSIPKEIQNYIRNKINENYHISDQTENAELYLQCCNIIKGTYLTNNQEENKLVNVFYFNKSEDLETIIIKTLINCKFYKKYFKL
jgi:hypothetical protein